MGRKHAPEPSPAVFAATMVAAWRLVRACIAAACSCTAASACQCLLIGAFLRSWAREQRVEIVRAQYSGPGLGFFRVQALPAEGWGAFEQPDVLTDSIAHVRDNGESGSDSHRKVPCGSQTASRGCSTSDARSYKQSPQTSSASTQNVHPYCCIKYTLLSTRFIGRQPLAAAESALTGTDSAHHAQGWTQGRHQRPPLVKQEATSRNTRTAPLAVSNREPPQVTAA